MTKISAATATEHLDIDGVEGHYAEIDGYTIGFETYHKDEDPSPYFAGLPDGACQARHWGVVLEGTLVIRYTDGTRDVIDAGEAYYAQPGHLPLFTAGTRVVEFSQSEELQATMNVVAANLEAMRAG